MTIGSSGFGYNLPNRTNVPKTLTSHPGFGAALTPRHPEKISIVDAPSTTKGQVSRVPAKGMATLKPKVREAIQQYRDSTGYVPPFKPTTRSAQR